MQQIQRYLPIGLLLAVTSKLLISGTSLSEMGVVFALSAVVSLDKYLEKSKNIQDVEVEVQNTLNEMKKTIADQNALLNKMVSEIDSVRTNVTSMKMAQGMKNVR